MRLIDSEGVNYGTYKYDAWGNILQMPSTNYIKNNPLRYRGYVYDPETELYYCQSRYYDPKIGRFLNADGLVSTGQGLLGNNMFAYCRNNPILRRDQNGHSDENSTNDQNNSDDLYELRGTISFGVSLNVSLFGFWGFGGQLCISLDLYGNAQIQGSLEGGLTTGDASSSLMVYTMVTNAPTVDKLNGPGYQVGGTIPIGPTTAVGYDSNILEDKEENTVYTGSTFSVGKVLPGSSPEVHVYWGETSPTTSFSYDVDNFWDVLYRCITGGYQ